MTTKVCLEALFNRNRMMQSFTLSGHMLSKLPTVERKPDVYLTAQPDLAMSKSSTKPMQTVLTKPVPDSSMPSPPVRICSSMVPTSQTHLPKPLHQNRASTHVLTKPSMNGGPSTNNVLPYHLVLSSLSTPPCKVTLSPHDFGKNTPTLS